MTADPVAHGTQFTDNLDAFNEYRRGVYLNGKRGEENFSKARDCFERAVKLDDGFALAHQGIAEYWTAIAWYCLDAPRNAYPKSLVSVMKALKAAPRLPEAWADLALIYEKYEGYEKAEEAYKKAIAFAGARYPKGYPSAHHWYGGLLSTQGEHARALEQGELAQSIDPASPIITAWVGLRHYYAGDYDDAIKELDKALFLDSDIAAGHWHRSWACAQVGQHKQAIENASRAVQLSKNNPLYKVNLAWTLAMSREKQNLAEAQRLVQELAVLARTRYISGYHMAAVHVALGDKDAAFRELDRAIEDKAAWRFYLKVDPRMAPLRSERRFAELVKKLGL